MSTKLSIIIPTLNSENVIINCIKSILKQSFDSYEIIVVDGESTDNTLFLIKSFNSPKIKIISEKDEGIYDAMNKGIIHSSGEWLYFMGADDRLSENVLEKIFTQDINSYDFIYGDVKIMPFGNVVGGKYDLKRVFYNNFWHQAAFFRKKVFFELGLFNARYKIKADYDLISKLFVKGYKTKYLPITVAEYYTFGFSYNKFDINYYNDYKYTFIEKFGDKFSLSEIYGSLWPYYHFLIKEEKKIIKAFRLFVSISYYQKNLRDSLSGIKYLILGLIKK